MHYPLSFSVGLVWARMSKRRLTSAQYGGGEERKGHPEEEAAGNYWKIPAYARMCLSLSVSFGVRAGPRLRSYKYFENFPFECCCLWICSSTGTWLDIIRYVCLWSFALHLTDNNKLTTPQTEMCLRIYTLLMQLAVFLVYSHCI